MPPGSFGRFRSLMVAIFAVTFLAEAVHFFVDNAFYHSAGVAVPERDALPASSAGSLLKRRAATSARRLGRASIAAPFRRRGGVATLPLMCGATALLAVLAAPAGALMLLAAVCLVKLMDEALRHGLYASGLLVMFQPLPPEALTRAHAMNGSYIEQITAGVSGLCLLVLTYFDLNRAWISRPSQPRSAWPGSLQRARCTTSISMRSGAPRAPRRNRSARTGSEAARTVALRLLDSPHPGTVAHALRCSAKAMARNWRLDRNSAVAPLGRGPSAALELVRVHRLIEARPALLERLVYHVGGAEEGAALCALAALDGAAAIERLILSSTTPTRSCAYPHSSR